MKKAYVFPGQGAQYPGMGKEIYDNIALAKERFEQANEILGFRITDVMFNGTAGELKATNVTQPAIFLHSTILAECYKSLSADESDKLGLQPYSPDMAAGHSLGEFSALVISGSMSFEDALRLVAIRAGEMQKCCEMTPGSMAAIIGLNAPTVEDICKQCEGIVIPANYNCDEQIVISGETKAVKQACALAKELQARRAIMLAVGGAFHSPLMKPAGVELGKAIEETKIETPKFPVYQNVTGMAETDPNHIRKNLLKQLTSPVRWSQSVKNMLLNGADYFLEIGPGRVLQGLIKRIVRTHGIAEAISKL